MTWPPSARRHLLLLPLLLSGSPLAAQAISSGAPAPPPAAPAPAPSGGALRALVKDGVLLRASLVSDLQADVAGGLEHGADNAGLGSLGVDLDLHRLVGIPGGQIHVTLAVPFGTSVQTRSGNYLQTQSLWFPIHKLELAQLAYEHTLMGGKLNLYAGRTNATAAFARTTYGCSFVSGSQCPFYLTLFTAGITGFPYVTWGARARFNPARKFYLQSGVFSIDPGRRFVSGFDLGLKTATGVIVPVEAGYETDFSNDRRPRHLRVGGWYNNAPSTDPLLNARRVSRVLDPGAPLVNRFARGGFYVVADQVLFRPDASRRALAIFGSFAAPFDSREILASQAVAGALFTGPWAKRPSDTAGLMVTRIVFTRPQALYLNQVLARNGGTGTIAAQQYQIEVNYGFRLARGVTVTPNLQYLVHPDIYRRQDATRVPGNALIVGVRAAISLGDLLGLPASFPM